MTKRLIAAACILALALPAAALAQPGATARLTILHTNDTHGHLLPFSYPTIVPAGSELAGLAVRRDIGGIARRASLAQKIRTEQKGRGIPVWLVDVGDYSDGTPFSTEYHGEADVAAMNAAGYDFATLGNHEFNNTFAQLQKLLAQTKHPVLLANAVERATRKPITQAWRVEKLGALRVGLFGLVSKDTASYPAAKEAVEILDPLATAPGIVETLRKQADIVILLSHCGNDADERIAAEVPGIDVIVGGHSHSRLPTGEFVWRGDELSQDDVNGTIIVQAHQWGGELGRLDLLFRKDAKGVWRVSRYRSRLLPITPDLPAEPMVAGVVEKFWQPIAPRFAGVVAVAAEDFSSRGDDDTPYHLVADAVRETFRTEIDLENTGGVRSPLVKGNVTKADLVALDPFDNTVILFKATGAEIKSILTRYVPYASGLRYRIVEGQLVEATIGGAPIDDARIYTGSTNSYFAGFALRGITQENTTRTRLEVLTSYLQEKGTVTPAYDGRRVIIGRRPREGTQP
ncbi:MAG TPA: bifunctional UDP-sugar hydrolase/5'-nucleotidase [Vicinamibacterales bacterium]|nr:bifunctional UDP-sugar hydrolase/5'-nucleotidase [Vicinamibacterales bacterium]HOQ60460.1 bifunctional UDP-sugar hydrolase/5'-nucleotidase [Vicinamibacterales bacterium]